MRVLPLTIPLAPPSSSPMRERRSGDWIIACAGPHPLEDTCGDILWRNKHSNTASALCSSRRLQSAGRAGGGGGDHGALGSLVAAAFSGLTSSPCRGEADFIMNRCIRIWNAECGHLVATLDRYGTAFFVVKTEFPQLIDSSVYSGLFGSVVPECPPHALVPGSSPGRRAVTRRSSDFVLKSASTLAKKCPSTQLKNALLLN